MENSRTIPPLTWLRAFEAAGRLGSFKLAAKELNVSPSTVSHQIRDLESHLTFPLFVRGSKQIELTDEGNRYLAPLQGAFDLIRSASRFTEPRKPHLRIGAFPFLGNEILAPNLGDIKAKIGTCMAEDIRISLHTETSRNSLLRASAHDRMDVLIRYGPQGSRNPFPGLLSLKLFDVSLVPIQSARIAAFTSIDELLSQPIIRVIGPFDGFKIWASAMGVKQKPVDFLIETDSFHTAALAVERGEGICLGVAPFIKPWIDQHRVQTLDQFACGVEEAAYLVYAPHNRDNVAIKELFRWLLGFLN